NLKRSLSHISLADLADVADFFFSLNVQNMRILFRNFFLHPDMPPSYYYSSESANKHWFEWTSFLKNGNLERPKKAGTEGGKGAQIIIAAFPKSQYLCTI
ncbi:MAG: hypothetical protein ACXWB4_05980, partial [Kaistella sp.]